MSSHITLKLLFLFVATSNAATSCHDSYLDCIEGCKETYLAKGGISSVLGASNCSNGCKEELHLCLDPPAPQVEPTKTAAVVGCVSADPELVFDPSSCDVPTNEEDCESNPLCMWSGGACFAYRNSCNEVSSDEFCSIAAPLCTWDDTPLLPRDNMSTATSSSGSTGNDSDASLLETATSSAAITLNTGKGQPGTCGFADNDYVFDPVQCFRASSESKCSELDQCQWVDMIQACGAVDCETILREDVCSEQPLCAWTNEDNTTEEDAFDPQQDDPDWPGRASSSGLVSLNIRTDAYPDEMVVTLRVVHSGDSSKDVATVKRIMDPLTTTKRSQIASFREKSTLSDSQQSLEPIVSVPIGDWIPQTLYQLEIMDKAGDGICCSYGHGWISVTDHNQNILWSTSGDYGRVTGVYLWVNEFGRLEVAGTIL